jgi:hypothetical protein
MCYTLTDVKFINKMKQFFKTNEGEIYFIATIIAFAVLLIVLDLNNIIRIN